MYGAGNCWLRFSGVCIKLVNQLPKVRRAIVSEVPLMYGIVAVVTGPALVSSVGISVTVSVPSNKVRVVIVLTKNVVKIISLVL